MSWSSETQSGRHNAGVNTPSSEPGSRTRVTVEIPNLDWPRARKLTTRWMEPLAERAGWAAALYLFVGIFTAVGFFALMWTATAITAGLLFVLIGIVLIRPTLRLAAGLCRVERSLAAMAGHPIAARPVAALRGLGFSGLRDPERWREIGFVILNVAIGPILGVVGLAGFSITFQLANVGFGGTSAPLPIDWILRAIALGAAALALGSAPRIALFVARFKAQVTEWFLGPDQLAAAEARVSVLSSQREEILDAVANERRRIERNLHDGVQQRLVAIGVDLGLAERHLVDDLPRARELLTGAREKIQGSISELRQIGRGLHPAILEDRGIDAALSAIVADAPIPISVHVEPNLALPTDLTETIYFVASEAVANMLKHAQARVASIRVAATGDWVRLTVQDDGIGGVDGARGTGVAGMQARVHAVDGTFVVVSPPGGPTAIVAEIPLRRDRP